MTSDGQARTRVEAMDALVYNVGHLRIGRLSRDASSSIGKRTPSSPGKQPLDALCGRGWAFTWEPPRARAFGLVQPRRRLLNGQLNDQANSCEVCQFVEIAEALRNLQFLKVWG